MAHVYNLHMFECYTVGSKINTNMRMYLDRTQVVHKSTAISRWSKTLRRGRSELRAVFSKEYIVRAQRM